MMHGDWLRRWATYTPEKIALVDAATGTRLSYRAFHQRANRLAAALRGRYQVGKGDRVAVLAHNSPATLELLFALGKLGAIMVPLNFRLSVVELAVQVQDCEPKVLFYGPDFADPVKGLVAQAPVANLVPYASDASGVDFEGLLAEGSDEPVEAEVGLEDPWIILYTSGTTGKSKGCILTHGTVTWNAVNTQVGWDLHHDDITLTHTPFFHTGGLNVLTTPLFHRGGTVVLMRQFDAARSLELIGKERITVVFAVPTMFQMMLEAPNFGASDFSSIRFFVTGGAPCPVPLIEAYAAKGLTFKQGYGLTEAGPNCFTLDGRDAVRKAGSVGFPNMHLDVQLVDDDNQVVPYGSVGELWIRGPHVTPGYWKNPEATASSLQDGWLRTGDCVRQDEEGYFYIVDRKKDMYISGGENVYPAEIEAVLYAHPAIAEAAVIGLPDPKWGEVGLAVVSLREAGALTEEMVFEHLRGRLAKYKIPKRVAFMEALPRNPTGKVLKPELRRRFVEEAAALS